MTNIACIPADDKGNKLYIKDLRFEKDRTFVKYKSTYNDIPFLETEIFFVDNNKNIAITGDNGKIIFRFTKNWLNTLK